MEWISRGVGYMNRYRWWKKLQKKTMNDFVIKQKNRGMNGFPSIWYTKRIYSLKQIFEDLMNGILNLEYSFYINYKKRFPRSTLLLHEWFSPPWTEFWTMNIPTTWSKFNNKNGFLVEHSYYMNEFHLWTVSTFEQKFRT
jgi:hypothetical protein